MHLNGSLPLAEVFNGSGFVSLGFFMLFFVVLFAVSIGSLVMFVLALIDIVKRPDWQWKLAGQEKVMWILLVVLVNFLAIPALIYWFNIRKKLVAVEAAAANGEFGPGRMTYAGWEPGASAPPPGGMPPAGWHADPNGQGQYRWWDGNRWTDHTWSAEATTASGVIDVPHSS